MLRAILRLFTITATTVILTFIAVFALRWIGSHQTYQAPPHAWFQGKDFWWIYSAGAEELCNAKSVRTLVPDAGWIVRVPIKRVNEEWLIPCSRPVKVEEFIAHSDHQDWLLDVAAADTFGLDKLIEKFEPLSQGRRFAALTHSQKAAKYLRNKAPQWVFAADSPSILRLKLFQELWMETSMDFWPDFVITNGARANQERLSGKNARELARRQKRVVWDFDAAGNTDPDFPVQGVMTARISEALAKFKK